jgi:hypothetical protein
MGGLTVIRVDVRTQAVDAFLTKFPGIITANLMRSMEDCKQPAQDSIYEAIVGRLIRVRANRPATKKRKGHGVPLIESGEYASSWKGHVSRKVGTKKDVITLKLAPEGVAAKSIVGSPVAKFRTENANMATNMGYDKSDNDYADVDSLTKMHRNKRLRRTPSMYNIPMEYLGLLLEGGTRRVKAIPHVGKLEAYIKPRMLNIIQKNLDELIK